MNHQEATVHLRHAHTPGEENPTTIVGSDKITIDMKNKNELQGAMTMLSNITTTITNIMLIMLKKNLKVNRFGMLVMMMRRSKIQGATMMHNHINMILVRRVVRE